MKKQQTKKQPQNKTIQSSPSSKPAELTFLEHIFELRNRLFWIVAVLIVTSSIGFQFKDLLVNFIVAPLHGEKLIYLTPGGGFSFIFTVCLYFGALLTIPVVVYHLYRFLQPVLGKTSRRFIAIIVVLSAALAAAGAIFGYMVAIPAAINFLTTFAGDAVAPSLTAESYLGFVVMYLLGLAALFQLPLLLFIFDHVRPFPPGSLLSSQRFVIIGAVIAAALITPTPDIVNQMIVAGPIIVVYQLGAIAVYLRRRAERRSVPKSIKRTVESRSEQDEERAQGRATPPAIAPIKAAVYVAPVTPATPAVQPVASTLSNVRSVDGFRKTVPHRRVAVPIRSNGVLPDKVARRTAMVTRSDTSRTHRGLSMDGITTVS